MLCTNTFQSVSMQSNQHIGIVKKVKTHLEERKNPLDVNSAASGLQVSHNRAFLNILMDL